MEFLEELNRAHDSGKAFTAAVIIAVEGTAPRHPGTKMIVYEDGTLAGTVGGGEVEQLAAAAALACLQAREPAVKTFPVIQSGGRVSGRVTIYFEPVFRAARLILCGAGHVAGRLVPLAKAVGFRVTVIDIREDEAVRERAAAADEFIREPSWKEGLDCIPEDPDSFYIACAFSFAQDDEILFHLLQRKSAYIGMLASPYKKQTIYNHLKERGVSEESLARVHAPVGLPIGAETPEEIALSIAAELVQVRNTRNV